MMLKSKRSLQGLCFHSRYMMFHECLNCYICYLKVYDRAFGTLAEKIYSSFVGYISCHFWLNTGSCTLNYYTRMDHIVCIHYYSCILTHFTTKTFIEC